MKTDPEVRFWQKVNVLPGDGCWEWTASVNEHGYGQFYNGITMCLAHRYSYELHVGPIPAGLVTDHLCRNIRCVRPDHLEPVPQRVNAQRGIHPQGADHFHGRKTHCPKGHPYDEVNTRITSTGRRECRACRSEYQRQWVAAHPGIGAEYQRRHRSRLRGGETDRS